MGPPKMERQGVHLQKGGSLIRVQTRVLALNHKYEPFMISVYKAPIIVNYCIVIIEVLMQGEKFSF